MIKIQGFLVLTVLLFSGGIARGEGSEINVNQEKDCYMCNPEVNLSQFKSPADSTPVKSDESTNTETQIAH